MYCVCCVILLLMITNVFELFPSLLIFVVFFAGPEGAAEQLQRHSQGRGGGRPALRKGQ